MRIVRRIVLEIIEDFEVEDSNKIKNVNKYADEIANTVKTEHNKVRVIKAERVI
jgi:hypothetical protein